MITLIIIVKISYVILRNLFTNRLFDNTLNVIINKFNKLFSHFSFFIFRKNYFMMLDYFSSI